MKKIYFMAMLSISILSYADSSTSLPKTDVIIENNIPISKTPDEILRESLIRSDIYKNYITDSTKIEATRDQKNEIVALDFLTGDLQIRIDFFDYNHNKISKLTKHSKESVEIKEWNLNGVIKRVENSDKTSGTSEEYSDIGKIYKKEKWNNKEKSYEIYFVNGLIKEKGQYAFFNGVWEKSGIWEEYYESGKIKTSYLFGDNEYYEINYVDDEKNSKNFEGKNIFKDGVWYKDDFWTFYDKGKLSYRANFSGEKGKFYNYYDEDASIISVETNVTLLKNEWVWQGQKIFYSNTGKILEKQFKNDNILGITGYYDNDKNTIRYKGERDLSKQNFEKIGTWIYFGENEKIQEIIEYSTNSAKIKEYYDYENNKLNFTGEMIKKGENYSWIGTQIYYDKNGNKEKEIIYDNDGNGKFYQYFENGNIYKEGNIFSDYIQNPSYYVGKMTEYDKTGKIKVEYSYTKGMLDGEILYYDTNEKLTVKKIYKNGELQKVENQK